MTDLADTLQRCIFAENDCSMKRTSIYNSIGAAANSSLFRRGIQPDAGGKDPAGQGKFREGVAKPEEQAADGW